MLEIGRSNCRVCPSKPRSNLLEGFLKPMELSQRELADGINVPYQRVNELINGRRGITPSTALRLAKFFGMTPDFWMNMQQRWDLYHARVNEAEALGGIRKTRPPRRGRRAAGSGPSRK